jgi:hypothetical protein
MRPQPAWRPSALIRLANSALTVSIAAILSLSCSAVECASRVAKGAIVKIIPAVFRRATGSLARTEVDVFSKRVA